MRAFRRFLEIAEQARARSGARNLKRDDTSSDDIVLSAQVLSEFYVSVRRLKRPLDARCRLREIPGLTLGRAHPGNCPCGGLYYRMSFPKTSTTGSTTVASSS
jgi:hypothetical protein